MMQDVGGVNGETYVYGSTSAGVTFPQVRWPRAGRGMGGGGGGAPELAQHILWGPRRQVAEGSLLRVWACGRHCSVAMAAQIMAPIGMLSCTQRCVLPAGYGLLSWLLLKQASTCVLHALSATSACITPLFLLCCAAGAGPRQHLHPDPHLQVGEVIAGASYHNGAWWPAGHLGRRKAGAAAAAAQAPASLLPSTPSCVCWPPSQHKDKPALQHAPTTANRYNGANPTKQRILTGTGSANHLSGFWGRTGLGTGVAHHSTWITNQVDRHGTNWVLSSNTLDLYRSNRVTRSTGTRGSIGSAFKWSIDYGSCCSPMNSDWAMAVLLYYNRTLALSEMESVEVGGPVAAAPAVSPVGCMSRCMRNSKGSDASKAGTQARQGGAALT
jgi:hypothetical protein